MGKVESISIWRSLDGEWEIEFAVDCGMSDLMRISRTSQTHMFHQPQTQAIVARVRVALEDLEQTEAPTEQPVTSGANLEIDIQGALEHGYWHQRAVAIFYENGFKGDTDEAYRIVGEILDPILHPEEAGL